ncbi:OmpA family protein [Neotamlana laminarinivorans]|uniref:OmpA family protein n=1 Tax=Neotamlana laminarinivorans TaxID=2883124 RepID=A0A9X1L2M2_9FLAO|nr:OmpA family protein [Tamlana laminarinivorans]MCB4799918.1 OmpA family protein [Tamlana laminarinivorans]
MKTKFYLVVFLISNIGISQQGLSNLNNSGVSNQSNNKINIVSSDIIGTNGFNFEILDAGVNTKFSELGSGFFRNKLILVSSKKIGDLAKIDPNTGEADKNYYCLDIDKNGQLSSPILFSRILNTKNSEDQLTFSTDQKTVYYTRSNKENSLEFKLYKAVLEKDSHGNWINEELLGINQNNVSIENPYVSPEGDKLYFASNMPDSFGGFDLYVSKINPDGSLGTPKNLGNTINTEKNEKYPSLSIDGKYLYFSSEGHQNIGGYDLFVSKISNNNYREPRNLGNTINTVYDELAYFLAAKNKGYVSSNRQGGRGSYDIYTAINTEIIQHIEGEILDRDTSIKLPNTLVVLKDDDNEEIGRIITGEDGKYNFNVSPFETYTITAKKDGFKDASEVFNSNNGTETNYVKNIMLSATEPIIAEINNELRILLENIYFEYNKYNIKEESTISLNKIVKVLKENPEMKIAINAHTDNKGSASYNLKLSDKRAGSAAKFLIKNGIDKNRLISKGFGETKPFIDCKNNCSDEDLQANRRVEFVILN